MKKHETLLYDLLELKEWEAETEEIVRKEGVLARNYPNWFGRVSHDEIPVPEWELCVSPDGSRLAVLRSRSLEIYGVPNTLLGESGPFRGDKEEASPGKCLAWTRDSAALIFSLGSKFVLVDGQSANLLYYVFSPHWGSTSPLSYLGFLGVSSPEWSDRLLAINDRGKSISFLIGKTGFLEFSSHNFGWKKGCSSAVYSQKYGMLIAYDWNYGDKVYSPVVWRTINQEPYFQKVDMHSEGLDPHPIVRISLSECESRLASLNSEGAIKIYRIPALNLHFVCDLESQPLYDEINPTFLHDPRLKSRKKDFLKSAIKWHPFKVEWWDSNAIIVSRYSGSVTVLSIDDQDSTVNLLGNSPEFFSDVPKVACRLGKYIFCLEREYYDAECEKPESEASQKSWLWPFKERVQNKRIESTYRLIAMIKTSPKELYLRKIDKEEYGEALRLAELFELDCDMVYVRRWQLSDHSSTAIQDFLSKINKSETKIEECLNTIPVNMEDAKELLKFGLKTVQSLGVADKDKTKNEEDLFVGYLKLLNTYQRIIRSFGRQEIEFNAPFFLNFRDTDIKESAQKFAQIGHWDAVRVIFQLHFSDISSHYFDLLSDISESYSPSEYVFLLPFANLKTRTVIFPFSDSTETLKICTYDQLMDWYNSRAITLEMATGLPDNSLDLLEFALNHGVEIDKQFYRDLKIVKTLIYDLGKIELNYKSFKNMSMTERIDTIVLKEEKINDKMTFVSSRVGKYLLKLLEEEDSMNPGSYNGILKEYFSRKNNNGLRMSKEIIFNLPENKVRDQDFVTLCLDSLFQDNDDFDCMFEILKYLMKFVKKKELDDMHTKLSINIIARKYGYLDSMKKCCQDYKDGKYIESIVVELCNNPAFLRQIERWIKLLVWPTLRSLVSSCQCVIVFSKCRQLPLTDSSSWSDAIDDIFTIWRSNPAMPPDRCFELTVTSLLKSENNRVVSRVVNSLSCLNLKKCDCFYHYALLKYNLAECSQERIQELLIESVEEHLKASDDVLDNRSCIADLCLNKTTGNNPVRLELKKVIKIGHMLKEFSISLPPSYIRDDKNSFTIIGKLLNKHHNNYKKYAKIASIASLLGDGTLFVRRTELLIAEKAFESDDTKCALTLIKNMIKHGYGPCSSLCLRVLKNGGKDLREEDLDTLNTFCLRFGEKEHLLEIISGQSVLMANHEEDYSTLPVSFQKFTFHPFYVDKPRIMSEIPSLGLGGPINEDNVKAWWRGFLNYDILGAVSLFSSIEGDEYTKENCDEKNYLFIQLYISSIRTFADSLGRDCFFVPPDILIAAAVKQQSSSPKDPHKIKETMAKYSNYIEAKNLAEIDKNIDVLRFIREKSYKLDTILGLSLTSDVKSFRLAMKYASLHSDIIEEWELCFNFLRSTFEDDPESVIDMLDEEKDVLNILSTRQDELRVKLKKYVFPTIRGTDYEKIRCFYRMSLALRLVSCSDLETYSELVEACEILNASYSELPPINLGNLLEDSSSFISTIKPYLISEKLDKIVQFAKVLGKANRDIDHGFVYLALCERMFEKGGCSIEDLLEKCSPFLRNMNTEQLKKLACIVCFENENISLNFQDKKEFLEEMKELEDESKFLEYIERLVLHIDKISQFDFPSTSMANQLLSTLGDEDEMKEVIVNRVVSGEDALSGVLANVIRMSMSFHLESVYLEILDRLSNSVDSNPFVVESVLKTDYVLVADTDSATLKSIHDAVVSWCLKIGNGNSEVNDLLAKFIRDQSPDPDSKIIVALHKSRSILSEEFQDVEDLLPDLNNRAQFLDQIVRGDNKKLNLKNLRTIVELINYWEDEEEEVEFDDIKSAILEYIIVEKATVHFMSDLSRMYPRVKKPPIDDMVDVCLKYKQVRFAFQIMKHLEDGDEMIKAAVDSLEHIYPLTFKKEEEDEETLKSSAYAISFSSWLREKLQ